MVVYFFPEQGGQRVLLEGLVGAWPSERPITKFWLAAGVTASALAVFGIPTVLGIVIQQMIDHAERRLQMQLEHYLELRDQFLVSWIASEIWNNLRKNGLSEEQIAQFKITDAVEGAIQEAESQWRQDTRHSRVGDPAKAEIMA